VKNELHRRAVWEEKAVQLRDLALAEKDAVQKDAYETSARYFAIPHCRYENLCVDCFLDGYSILLTGGTSLKHDEIYCAKDRAKDIAAAAAEDAAEAAYLSRKAAESAAQNAAEVAAYAAQETAIERVYLVRDEDLCEHCYLTRMCKRPAGRWHDNHVFKDAARAEAARLGKNILGRFFLKTVAPAEPVEEVEENEDNGPPYTPERYTYAELRALGVIVTPANAEGLSPFIRDVLYSC